MIIGHLLRIETLLESKCIEKIEKQNLVEKGIPDTSLNYCKEDRNKEKHRMSVSHSPVILL